MEYTKKDETTLLVTKPIENIEKPAETQEYKLSFLKEQVLSITKQRDEMIALKEKELAEVEKLIVEAEKLGIVEKEEVVEEIIEEELITK
jgi:predicted lactoylglutathione lyase